MLHLIGAIIVLVAPPLLFSGRFKVLAWLVDLQLCPRNVVGFHRFALATERPGVAQKGTGRQPRIRVPQDELRFFVTQVLC